MSVFIDTSAVMAVLSKNDLFHKQANRIWVRLLEDETRLVTHSFVISELYALVQNRISLNAIRTLAKDVLPLFEVKWVENEIYEQAVAALLGANRRELSLTDCISFTIMRRNHIEKAFSFDNHFNEQGFTLLS
jgi:predicted nucleic acid-binding protein